MVHCGMVDTYDTTVRYGRKRLVRCSKVQYGTVQYGTTSMVQYGKVWHVYRIVWYDIIWW